MPLLFSVVAIILNIVLNLWLINGGFGVPAMGVAGAALATTISRGVQAVVMVVMLVKMDHFLAVRLTDFYQANDLKEWRKLIILIVPMMFSFGVWALGSFCYQLIFGRLGTNELAVISMLLPLEGMFLSLFLVLLRHVQLPLANI
ncbi:polysaccharide biosynthesis C-terminal domain-containing protein [Psychrosphaera algicola]|uniref:Polysaccharide biosynthesis C-terminal domain-containing protein n=1 Tax=Psychrosphaera algicola TaxID=3023714 RepID=A0ABT5FEN2_9GAMM|nr:polysaccharide biosynthesis C-terminal domain-containing protein [Psychrosphaera sp. G1-22]MDC2889100.1 polysaccharide biosynthesis C-terminal domain-containing protein [Psychrosphaera sp. G1-22]